MNVSKHMQVAANVSKLITAAYSGGSNNKREYLISFKGSNIEHSLSPEEYKSFHRELISSYIEKEEVITEEIFKDWLDGK